jgi:hypothetical protein
MLTSPERPVGLHHKLHIHPALEAAVTRVRRKLRRHMAVRVRTLAFT